MRASAVSEGPSSSAAGQYPALKFHEIAHHVFYLQTLSILLLPSVCVHFLRFFFTFLL